MVVWKRHVVMLKHKWYWLKSSQRAIDMVTSAIGDNEIPVAYLLGEQYIKAMQDMAKSPNAKTVVLPADVLNTHPRCDGPSTKLSDLILHNRQPEGCLFLFDDKKISAKIVNLWLNFAFIFEILLDLMLPGFRIKAFRSCHNPCFRSTVQLKNGYRMSSLNPTLITFLFYIVAMVVIGLMAYRATSNFSDYILGGRRLGSFVTALSAGASDMSGWLLMGLPGAIYLSGLSEMWIAIGLIIGAWLNWLLVAGRLRFIPKFKNNALTLPDYFSNRFNDQKKILRVVSAFVILISLRIYCASGMVAGARLFESMFDMSIAQRSGLVRLPPSVMSLLVAFWLSAGPIPFRRV